MLVGSWSSFEQDRILLVLEKTGVVRNLVYSGVGR